MTDRLRLTRRGLSMIEVMVSMLLVASILVVSLTASGNLLHNHTYQSTGVDGKLITSRILDEVTALGFEDPNDDRVFGVEPSENALDRTTWDDVDDYHGLSLSPPTTRDGDVIDGYSGWSLSIAVSPAEPTAEGVIPVADTAAPLRRVTITCTSPTGVTHVAEAFVSNVVTDLADGLPHQRWRSLVLTFPDGSTIDVDTPLKNRPAVEND